MMPEFSPAPLSAWTLLGTIIAYPQPFANTCCCQLGWAGPFPAGNAGRFGPLPDGKPKPNSMMTGTGPAAFSGVVSVNWMFTVTSGYEELSTCPINRLVMTGTS